MKIYRKGLWFGALVLALVMGSVQASDSSFSSSKRDLHSAGDNVVLDALVLRPIGLATTVAGSAVYVISLPFSLLGGNEEQARESLVVAPARYTFKRPLGEPK